LQTREGSGGEAKGDHCTVVESISAFAFAVTVAATLDSRGGDATLIGSIQAEVFIGEIAADSINGLGGKDRTNYMRSTVSIQINFATNIKTGGDAFQDSLTRAENSYGSNIDDAFIGEYHIFMLLWQRSAGCGLRCWPLDGMTWQRPFRFQYWPVWPNCYNARQNNRTCQGCCRCGWWVDFATALVGGGSSATATATRASISTGTAVATFAVISSSTLADALADITAGMTTAAGEFTFFRVNNAGTNYLLIHDGLNGLGTGDSVVGLTGITSMNGIDLSGRDLTIVRW
jgi:hypothetical protein